MNSFIARCQRSNVPVWKTIGPERQEYASTRERRPKKLRRTYKIELRKFNTRSRSYSNPANLLDEAVIEVVCAHHETHTHLDSPDVSGS